MRRTAAGLALAATALLPAAAVAPASTGTTEPSTVVGAAATVPSAARAGAPAGGTASAGAQRVPVDFPRPPPVDVDLLPGDGPPTAAPGVRQESACVGATHTPDRAMWPNLLWGQRLFSL
ncbi:MAG: hypothetical protein QOG96_3350, partial [Pseudonocardiales bacterium]|nr:hypothetical protein [Pseudonocardiales bacterium]